MFSESEIRVNRWVMRAMMTGGPPYRCWSCEDSGKIYEKAATKHEAAWRSSMAWIPCPHCKAGKERADYAAKREVIPPLSSDQPGQK